MHELQDSTTERSVTIEVTIPEGLHDAVVRFVKANPHMDWVDFWQSAAAIRLLQSGDRNVGRYYLESTLPECKEAA